MMTFAICILIINRTLKFDNDRMNITELFIHLSINLFLGTRAAANFSHILTVLQFDISIPFALAPVKFAILLKLAITRKPKFSG